MKKKLLVLACMITCIFGLTACGEKGLTEYEDTKLAGAEQMAVNVIVPTIIEMNAYEDSIPFDEYTGEEVANTVYNFTYYMQQMGEMDAVLSVDGYGFKTAMESFKSAQESMGGIVSYGNPYGKISGNQIVVSVDVKGEKKDAKAEIIVSNDQFLTLKSASLNPESTIGELMSKAGLNTLIGMGTVFIVLILISLIISCFSIIPKIQKSLADRKEAKKETTGIDNAVAQITAQEEVAEEADDLELVAVIAAAIAASEGRTSTDGFVVRSIRKRM